MANQLSELESREKGAIDISIGTALGIQAACGIAEDGTKKISPPLLEYDRLLINIRTLFRNVYSLVDKTLRMSVDYDSLITVMMSEVRVINAVIEQYVGSGVKVEYYACDYNHLTRFYRLARFKDVSTDLQKIYSVIENKAVELMFKQLREEGIKVYHFDTSLNVEERNKTLIITHLPVDLLSSTYFDKLDLLETHTGTIKKKTEWNTKLKNGKDTPRIPFDKMTIQMFGDSGGLFLPYPIKYRKALIDIAEKYKWTSTTTKSRIKLTVKSARIHDLEQIIHQMYM